MGLNYQQYLKKQRINQFRKLILLEPGLTEFEYMARYYKRYGFGISPKTLESYIREILLFDGIRKVGDRLEPKQC